MYSFRESYLKLGILILDTLQVCCSTRQQLWCLQLIAVIPSTILVLEPASKIFWPLKVQIWQKFNFPLFEIGQNQNLDHFEGLKYLAYEIDQISTEKIVQDTSQYGQNVMVWKLQNFSETQILREIKIGESRVSKFATLTH